jgi:signal transduction histidine kinase
LIISFLKKYYFSFIIGLILITGLYFISSYSYLLYHSIIELFTVLVASGIFIIAWNAKKFLDNCYLLFIGIAYLFVAALDLFHTLAYSGMGIFTNFDELNLATQLWISARYLQSISMLIAVFFITRRLNYKIQFICYLIVTSLILLSIFYLDIFPDSYIYGSGLTTFKIVSEYIISFILAAAIFLLHIYRKEFNKSVFILIVVSLFIAIFSELSFTLYLDVYGLLNQLGHFLRLISFFLIYKAVIETGFSQPFDLLFFKLRQSEKTLKKNEEKYHSLYSSMNEGVALHEMIYNEEKVPIDYRIIDINDAYESILGITRNQVINKKASEVYKTDIAPYLNDYAKVIDSGKPVRFETYFAPMKKHFLISAFSPSKRKFATIFSDITKRKNIELEIRSISRFPLENPNPVMRINNKNLIIFANKPARNILQQLENNKKRKLLEFLHNSFKDLTEKKNNKSKTVEVKINKSIYEFTVAYIKEFDYFNIYGRDITTIKEAEKLSKRISRERIRNKERNKMARDLHDTVSQTLFSANLTADIIPKLWKKNPEVVTEKLEELRSLNNAALMDMRALLYELRPSALKNKDLSDLLNNLVVTAGTRSNIPVELLINGKYRYPSKIELSYYRIAQEALNNIIKHSCATKASLVLKILPEKLFMEISDNGRGFNDKKIAPTNLGLTIIRERAKYIGASIQIDSSPGKGTSIVVIYNNKALVNK